MDDAAKCRMIAEFEGDGAPIQGQPITIERDGKRVYIPNYPKDLNATMRAARRLEWHAKKQVLDAIANALYTDRDPARAAFECMYQFVAEGKG